MTSLMIRAATNAVPNAYEYVYEYEVMNMHFIHEYLHFAVVMQMLSLAIYMSRITDAIMKSSQVYCLQLSMIHISRIVLL